MLCSDLIGRPGATDPRNWVQVITGHGTLRGSRYSSDLVDTLATGLRQGITNVIFDATALTYLDRDLCWALESQAQKLRSYGGALYVVGASEKIRALVLYAMPGFPWSRISFVHNEKEAENLISQRLTIN